MIIPFYQVNNKIPANKSDFLITYFVKDIQYVIQGLFHTRAAYSIYATTDYTLTFLKKM